MEKALQFNCPICGSICQTTEDMRGKQFQCLMCVSKIVVPVQVTEMEGLDIQYFLEAGVVHQRLKATAPPNPAPDPPKSQ
jgi:hypothetical protein